MQQYFKINHNKFLVYVIVCILNQLSNKKYQHKNLFAINVIVSAESFSLGILEQHCMLSLREPHLFKKALNRTFDPCMDNESQMI